MKQKIYSEGTGKISFRGFPGIDLRYPLDGSRGAAVADNFRIGKDGSLTGRCGFGKKASFTGNVDGFADLDSGIYMCSDDRIFKIDRATGEISGGEAKVLSNTGGRVGFFELDGQVYVADGASVKVYRSGATTKLSDMNGYAPLVGKLWDPDKGGERYESENLASNRVRITYNVTTAANMLYTGGFAPTSIDLIEHDGEEIDTSAISFNEDSGTIEGPDGCFPVGIISVWMTIRQKPQNSSFSTVRSFAKASAKGIDMIFAYGAAGYNGTAYPYIFSSRPVSDEDMEATERAYGNADRIYFPASGRFLANTGIYPVTGICPFDDRVLIFSEYGSLAFPFPFEGEPFPVQVSPFAGCANAYSFARLGGSVVSASKSGLFLHTPDRESFDLFTVKRLSEPLGSGNIFPDSAGMSLYFSKLTDEIFIVGGGFQTEKTPVYSVGSGCFYTYSGFTPIFMLGCAGENCFFDGTRFCGFSESLSYDTAQSSTAPAEIKKEYRSCLIPIADPGKVRRPSRIGLTAALDDSTATLKLLDAAGKTVSSHTLTGVQNVPYVSFSVRPARKRGSFFAVSLTSESGTSARIFDLMLEAGE